MGGVVVRQMALNRRHFERRRQVVHHGVEQLLHALVLERRAAQHGHHGVRDRRLAEDLADLLLGQTRWRLQILVEDRVVLLHDRLEQLVAHLGDRLLERLGHRSLEVFLAERVVVVHDLDLADDVDQPGEQLARAQGELDRHGLGAEALPDHRETAVEVGAHAVHLVDEDDARDVVAIGLAPHRLGLRLHAAHGVEQGDRAVQHAQAALHFHREVHVPGGVDDVDAVLLVAAGPEGRRRGRRDGDAPLLLLLHPVHRGRAVVHLTQLVGAARVVQDALGRSRFPGINVGHDADIPNFLERRGTRHCLPLSSKNAGRPGRPRTGRSRSAVIRGRLRPLDAGSLAAGSRIVGHAGYGHGRARGSVAYHR